MINGDLTIEPPAGADPSPNKTDDRADEGCDTGLEFDEDFECIRKASDMEKFCGVGRPACDLTSDDNIEDFLLYIFH